MKLDHELLGLVSFHQILFDSLVCFYIEKAHILEMLNALYEELSACGKRKGTTLPPAGPRNLLHVPVEDKGNKT